MATAFFALGLAAVAATDLPAGAAFADALTGAAFAVALVGALAGAAFADAFAGAVFADALAKGADFLPDNSATALLNCSTRCVSN